MLFVVVSLVFVGMIVAGWAVLGSSPERLIRAYEDPRLVARADELERELGARGWRLVEVEHLPTIRRYAREDPRGGELALRVGCLPGKDWCALELGREVGLAEGEVLRPAVAGDRDGPIEVTPDLLQRSGPGFTVRPIEARSRLSAPLLAALAEWPSAWWLMISGATVSVRADVRGAAEIEAYVAGVLARLAG